MTTARRQHADTALDAAQNPIEGLIPGTLRRFEFKPYHFIGRAYGIDPPGAGDPNHPSVRVILSSSGVGNLAEARVILEEKKTNQELLLELMRRNTVMGLGFIWDTKFNESGRLQSARVRRIIVNRRYNAQDRREGDHRITTGFYKVLYDVDGDFTDETREVEKTRMIPPEKIPKIK